MRRADLRWALVAVLGVLGCTGGDWVIAGAEGDAEPEPGGADAPPLQVMPPEECPTALALLERRAALYRSEAVGEAYTGVWRGALTGPGAAGFPGATVELQLDAAGQGSLSFEALPPPAAMDGSSGYLCSTGEDGAVLCGSRSGFVGGFAYPLERLTSRGDVLSFVVVEADPWASWCELQAPVEWPDLDAPCERSFDVQLPATDTVTPSGCSRIDADGVTAEIDCELMYTLRHCDCGRDACIATFEQGIEVGLELGDGGTALIGSLWYSGDVDAARVTLRR